MKSFAYYRKFRKNNRRPQISENDRLKSENLFEQGKQCMKKNQNNEALKLYDEAIAINPYNFKAYCNKGVILKNMEQYDSSRKTYLECLTLNQDDIISLYNYGNLQKHVGNCDKAIVLYNETIQKIEIQKQVNNVLSDLLESTRLNCYINISVSYKIINKLNEAIQWCKKTIQKYPNQYESYFNQGTWILKQIQDKSYREYTVAQKQKCQEALKLLKKSLELNPKELKVKLALIQCEYIINQTEQNFEKALKKLSELKQVKQGLSKSDKQIIQQKQAKLTKINKENVSENSKESSIMKQSLKLSKTNQKQRSSSSNLNASNLGEQFMIEKQSNVGKIFYYSQDFTQLEFQWLITHEKYNKAKEIAENMVDSFQKNQKLMIVYLLLGSQSEDEQLVARAVKIYEQVIRDDNFDCIKDRVSIKGHDIIGYILMEQKKYDVAAMHYQYILEKVDIDKLEQSKNFKLNFWLEQLSICYFSSQIFDEGIRFCRVMVSKFPNSIKLRLVLSYIEIRKSMREQAYQNLQKVKDVENKLSYEQKMIFHLAWALVNQGNQKQIDLISVAVKDINKATLFFSQFIVYIELIFLQFSRVGELLIQNIHNKKQMNKVKLFEIARKCNASLFSSKFEKQILLEALGQYHLYKGQYSQSLQYLKKITKDKDQINIKIGLCEAKLQKQADASFSFQSSTKLIQNNKTTIQKQLFNWAFKDKKTLNSELLALLSCECLKKIENRKFYGLWVIQTIQFYSDCLPKQSTLSQKQIIDLIKQNKCCQIVKQINENKNKVPLIVLSLNYSGVLTSPYEYHEQEDEKENYLNEIFTQEVQKVYPEFRNQKPKKFQWEMGILDTRWKDRYSAFNQITAGVKQNGKMMSEKQFKAKWEQVHQKTRQSIKKNYFELKYVQPKLVEQKMKTQIEKCRQFDLFCYKTFMRIIYGVTNLNRNDIDSQQYIQIRQKDFSKSYLNQAKKIEQTLFSLENIEHHVLFLQESHSSLVEELEKTKKYHIIKKFGVISVIVLNQQSKLFMDYVNFEDENKKFLQKWAKINNKSIQQIDKQLNFNKDSIYQVYKNFIFLNVHLTSNKQTNGPQMNAVKVLMHRLKKQLPQYNLVFGGDFNQKFNDKFEFEGSNQILAMNFFPNDMSIPTCKKKRTLMQPQRKKALVLDQSGKDYIVSELPILDAKIMLMNGDEVKEELPLLPNKDHPYDHYVVYTKFEYINKR